MEWIAVGVLACLFVWRGLIPAWRSLNTDFPNYYLAAKLFHEGYPLDRIYDWIWFQRQKDHAGLEQGLVGCIEMSPFSAVVLVPILFLPALQAKQVWVVFNAILLLVTGSLLRAISGLPARRVALMIFLCVVPLRTNFNFGQQHLLLLFLLSLAAWMLFGRRPFNAGLVLAIAAALKIYPALFLLYFARKRDWRAFAGLAAGLVMLAVLSLWLFGSETLQVYAFQIIPRVLKGEGNQPYLVTSNSPTVLLRRLFIAEPDLNPNPLLHAPAAFAVLQPLIQNGLLIGTLWLLRARHGGDAPGADEVDFAAYLALLLILSPGSSTYHFCVLILAATLALGYLMKRSRARVARALVVTYALTCAPIYRFFPAAPSGWRVLLGFPRLYALAAVCALILGTAAGCWGRPERGSPLTSRASERSPAREWKLAISIFAVLALVGALSLLGHMKGQFANYSDRVPVEPASDLTATPSAGRNGIYYTQMEANSYGMGRTGDALSPRVPPLTDLFHPAVETSGSSGWLEWSANSSRIVRFPLAAPGWSVAQLPVEVENGEDPAVSIDARWLGFLREEHGRAGLWIVDRRPTSVGALAGAASAEYELVASTSDVLDFTFVPDGRIVFSARPDGQARLFVVEPTSRRMEPFGHATGPARYPAVSPDGRWLVYSQQEGATWQLWVADVSGAAGGRRLTNADCNSISATWLPDSRRVVYATDCGRAVGQTALCRQTAIP